MLTKELIKKLLLLDPVGECEVLINNRNNKIDIDRTVKTLDDKVVIFSEIHTVRHVPSIETVKFNHSGMTEEEWPEDNDYGHRTYGSNDEVCYLCVVLERMEKAEKRVKELENQLKAMQDFDSRN